MHLYTWRHHNKVAACPTTQSTQGTADADGCGSHTPTYLVILIVPVHLEVTKDAGDVGEEKLEGGEAHGVGI